MLIAIGSKNPVKIKAVKSAFLEVYPREKLDFKANKVSSDVSNQPMSDLEGIKGAKNRAKKVLKKYKADFGVGLEGCIQKIGKDWFDCGWVIIMDKQGKEGMASTARVHVASKIMKLIRKGYELGAANDILTGENNTKQNMGHFGIMTNGILKREEVYKDAVITALGRWIKKEFYE